MRELAILTFVSLDGVMESPMVPDEDSPGSFIEGGWAKPYWDNVMENVGKVAMSQPYDVLLGRTTYDEFVPFFSGSDSPLDSATKYVVSSQPIVKTWKPTIRNCGDIPAEINALKAQDGPLLQVHGSHTLIQLLLKHQLVDEYRIWTFPVVLGSGKRLFGSGSIPNNLVLQKSIGLASGAIMSIYRNEK